MDVDSLQLVSGLQSFLGDLLQNETIRSAWPMAAAVLEKYVPGLPSGIDKLPEFLVSAIPSYYYRGFDGESLWHLEGDLCIARKNGSVTGITVSGCLDYHPGGRKRQSRVIYPVFADISLVDSKPFLRIEAELPFGDVSVFLDNQSFSAETRGSYYSTYDFSLEGTYDRSTGDFQAAIYNRNKDEVGRMAGKFYHDGLDLDIEYYYDVIRVRLNNNGLEVTVRSSIETIDFNLIPGNGYMYGEIRYSSYRLSYHYDLWMMKYPDDEFRIRIAGSNSDARNVPESYSLAIGKDQFSARVHLFYYGEPIDGILQFKLTPTGPILDTDIIYGSTRIICEDGKLTANIYGEQFVLEKTEGTAERMAWTLTRNAVPLYTLELALRDTTSGKAFSALLTQETDTIFSLDLSTVAKVPVSPIDTAHAIVLTPEMIAVLLRLIR